MRTRPSSKRPLRAVRTISLPAALLSPVGRHRLLLWLWKHVPFPRWVRQVYVEHTHPQFLVGVVAYITNPGGEVLLFHHTYRQRYSWSLPGGYLERNESPYAGIEREVREESGLTIRADEILAAAFHSPEQLDLLIRCEIVSGSPIASPEVDDWKYVRQDTLGTDLPNHRTLLTQAGLLATAHRNGA